MAGKDETTAAEAVAVAVVEAVTVAPAAGKVILPSPSLRK
jgi:hypothetical protein